MPTPVDTWDEALFGCPQIDGYRMKREPVVEARPPIDGTSRHRQRSSAPITVFSLVVPQDQEQHQNWLAWYETTLEQGTEWFDIQLYFGTTARTVGAHITGGWSMDEMPVGALNGDLAIEVETYNAQQIVYEHPETFIVYAGTALDPSPVADTYIAGEDAANPSPDEDVIYGGDQVGLP